MKDLRKQALVLIYPDGEIKKVPVMKGKKWHLEYFQWLLENSQKFATIVYHFPYKINFKKDWDIIDRMLALANVIVIRNNKVYEIAEDISYNEADPILFLINLPENIENNCAYPIFKQLMKEHEKEIFKLRIYNSKDASFDDIENTFLEEIENEEKERRI